MLTTKPKPNKPPSLAEEQADGMVTITIEIDTELLAQVTEVLKPYGLTPEAATVRFFEYCTNPRTQEQAIELLKQWKAEQGLLEKKVPMGDDNIAD